MGRSAFRPGVAVLAGGLMLAATVQTPATAAASVEVDHSRNVAHPIGSSSRAAVSPATQLAELFASDGSAGDLFGSSIAVSGTVAIVGAPGRHNDTGAAYVFSESGGVWTQQAELSASDGAPGDHFAYSVALSGGTAVIGAYGHGGGASGPGGAAYVFDNAGGTWVQQAELTAADGAPGGLFGYSVAALGGVAFVGGSLAYPAAGAVYVFTNSGGQWTQQGTLTASDGAGGDEFGYSLSLSGGTLLVGAEDRNQLTGAAYIFTGSAASWAQQAELTASYGVPGDHFGTTLSLSGNTAVIGATHHNNNTGAAYIFSGSGTNWAQQTELTASDGVPGDWFGSGAVICGGNVLVGAHGHNNGAGSAYLYAQSANWAQQEEITASDASAGDGFTGGALSDSAAFLGAPNHSGTGAVYVYAIPPTQAAAFVTPDIKVIQYIHPLDAKQCARDLVAQLGLNKLSALAACGFLSVSANPLPPPRFPDDQTWSAFVDSKEYRGFVHIPPLTVSCSGGEVAAIDNIPVGGPGLHGLILPGFEHSLGFTPGRPFEPYIDYAPAEPFVTDAGGSSVAALMNNDGVFEVNRPGGNALITYMTASRIATFEREAAFPIFGFDAPYIWTVTQLRVDCGGDESVSIANSEFPTTNLYINGRLVRFYRQADLPQFIKDGGRTLNPPGVGYLALNPTCGTDVHWGTKALLGQPVPGSCFFDILNGPTGGATGLYL
jgi:FG-GAP repeat